MNIAVWRAVMEEEWMVQMHLRLMVAISLPESRSGVSDQEFIGCHLIGNCHLQYSIVD